MELFTGIKEGQTYNLYIDGKKIDINDSLKLHYFSPDFSWGYMGSGCQQTSLAILLACCGDDIATEFVTEFKVDFVSNFEDKGFVITSDCIWEWINKKLDEWGKQNETDST